MKYYSAKTVTQILGVTAQTLRNWDKDGKLKPAYTKSVMDIDTIVKKMFFLTQKKEILKRKEN